MSERITTFPQRLALLRISRVEAGSAAENFHGLGAALRTLHRKGFIDSPSAMGRLTDAGRAAMLEDETVAMVAWLNEHVVQS